MIMPTARHIYAVDCELLIVNLRRIIVVSAWSSGISGVALPGIGWNDLARFGMVISFNWCMRWPWYIVGLDECVSKSRLSFVFAYSFDIVVINIVANDFVWFDRLRAPVPSTEEANAISNFNQSLCLMSAIDSGFLLFGLRWWWNEFLKAVSFCGNRKGDWNGYCTIY